MSQHSAEIEVNNSSAQGRRCANICRELLGKICGSPKSKSIASANDDYKDYLNNLRLLRTEVMDLIMVIQYIRNGQLSFDEATSSLKKSYCDIDNCIKILYKNDSGNKHQQYNRKERDFDRKIKDLWKCIENNPLFSRFRDEHCRNLDASNNNQSKNDDGTNGQSDNVVLLRRLGLIEDLARKMALEIGYRTIPQRVNDWLEHQRPGCVLPFDLVFEDELVEESDRKKVLQFLSWKPADINHGLVDVASGLIYRYPDTGFWVLVRNFLILGALAAFTLLFIYWRGIDGWLGLGTSAGSYDSEISAVIVWFGVLSGIVVHKLIGNAKDNQGTLTAPFRPVGEWPLYLSARTSQILFGISVAVITTFALIFLADELEPPSIEIAFLAGYSMDSFAGLFASGLERASKTQSQRLGQLLGAESQKK